VNLAYSDLTRRLVEMLPELEPAFAEEQEWWEEEEVPPHIAYGDLLTPLLEELLVSRRDEPLLGRAFSLLEELSSSDDPLVQEVVTDTICEYIVDRPALYFPAKRFMGEKTAKLCTGTEVD
jgi:hypothetical protein